MKTNLKLILSAAVVAALPSTTEAQPLPPFPPIGAGTVTAITAIPAAGNNVFTTVGHGLQVATICHDGGAVLIAFQNVGSEAATLNFLFSDGSTLSASGLILAPSREFDAAFKTSASRGSSFSPTALEIPPSACTLSTVKVLRNPGHRSVWAEPANSSDNSPGK